MPFQCFSVDDFGVFVAHICTQRTERKRRAGREHFTNMQNKFDRQKIRICSELWGEVFLVRGRTVVYVNVVGYKAMAAFDSWKENRFFQLFSSSGRLSFRLLHSEIRPFLPSPHYPRLVRTAWKSITVKPNRISFSALKQIFNLRSSRQTKQACRNSPDVRWQRAAASFLHS